jgi:hypothetical protein
MFSKNPETLFTCFRSSRGDARLTTHCDWSDSPWTSASPTLARLFVSVVSRSFAKIGPVRRTPEPCRSAMNS